MKIKTFSFISILSFLLTVSVFAQSGFKADATDNRNQASFISDAPFEKIVGVANGLEANVMLDINNITNNPKGMVKVPVDKIKTGIDLRDEHLRSKDWLYADKYPAALFELISIENSNSNSLSNGKKTDVKLKGKFSVHGVTNEVIVPATLTYFKENEMTKSKMPGNLLVVNTEFNIKLSDYGIRIPDMVVGKVNDEVKITANFVASDAANMTGNPCNPCSTTEGKCNPCKMKEGKCNPCKMKKG
ncbi:MAG: hypothetical protein Kow0098_23770 [Ignavibacteriaceae bacterium]